MSPSATNPAQLGGVQPELQSSKLPRVAILSSKGLSTCVAGIVLVVALLKADSKDIPKIIETLTGSNTFLIVGWVLAFVFLIGSVVVVKLLMSLHGSEIARVSAERDSLQKKLIERS